MRELSDEEVGLTAPPPVELSDADVGLAPPAPARRAVGAGEVTGRAGSAFLHSANAYAAAPVLGVTRIADAVTRLFGGRGEITDALADRFVVPSLRTVERARIDPAVETAGPVGDVVVPAAAELGKAVPDLATGAWLQSGAPKLVTAAAGPVRAVAERLINSVPVGVPAGFRRGVERTAELESAGVDPLTAAAQGAASGVMTTGQFAMPASAGSALPNIVGRVLSRGGQGAALNTAAGLSAQQAENAMLPEGAESLEQDVFTPENVIPQAVLGALFGQMGGRLPARARPQTRADLGYDHFERAGLEPVVEPRPYDPPPIYDPQAATKEVGEALFRTEDGAPQPPEGMQLVPRNVDAPLGRVEPDVSEVPVRVAPEWDAPADPAAGRVRREFGEPRMEADDSIAARLAARVEAETDAMRPNVPMSILKTIDTAARDSGLEGQIRPRIEAKEVISDGQGQRQGARPPPVLSEPPAAPLFDQPASAPPPAPVEKPQKVARGGTAFLQAVKAAGGIDPKFAAEIGGDTPMVLNRRLPGLMRKGGMSEDALLEWAQDNGYLTAADVARADKGGVGGAVEVAKNLVRRAMGDQDVHRMADEGDAFSRDARAGAEQEMYSYAENRGIDTTGKAPEEVDAEISRLDMAEALREQDLPPASEADVALIARAAEIDEVAVERLAQQADGGGISEAQFMDGIRRIADGEQRATEGASGEAVQEPPRAGAEARQATPEGGAVRPATAPEFQLERPTESGLRERADAGRRAGDERARVEAAPPAEDFTLTGSNRPADEAAARGQQELKPDKVGGGTLYGGLPLDKIAKAIGWAVGDTKAWSDSIGRFANDLRDAGGKTPSPEGNVVGRFFRAVFDSASGDMRSVLKKNPSATAQSVIDHFHTEAGSARHSGEIYSSAVNAWTNKLLSRLDGSIKEFEGNKQALEQIAALVRNPRGIKPGSKIHDAAQTIRTLLDDALKYMRAAGVEIGEVRDGYYPREFDMREVMRNPKAFIDAAARAYREGGASATDALAAAKQLHDGMVFGESGSIFRTDKGSPQAPFLKGRVFGKQVDDPKHPLHDFLMHDPSQSIPIYLERAAKRAEIARRFGDNFSKWGEIEKKVIAEGGGAILPKLRDYVTLAAKLKAPGVSDFSLRASSVARTWGSLMFLEKATLSSLTEFIVPAIRTGNALDIARSLKNTVSDLVNETKGATERRAFAEDLGIIASKLSDQVSAARFSGGEPVSMLESKILGKYFRRTGLTQWTDATFVSAADLGRVFLRRLSKEMDAGGGKLAERHLAELGVPKEQAKAFAKYALSKNDGMPGAGDLDGPLGDVYRTAIRRFAQQSIMRPDATLRPGWMAHPIGSIVGQLQSFNYAFFENVLKRNARLAKEAVTGADYTMIERARLLMPTMMLPMLVGAAYAVGEARDAAFGDPERRKEETGAQKVLKAASRGMPIAPLDPLLNYATAARYQRGATDVFAGPVLGTAGRGMDAVRNVLANNSPNTNTAERQAAKAVYDIFIEPAVNLMLTASPVTLVAAAATQAAGSGRLRERFVTAAAGEGKKTNQNDPRTARDTQSVGR